MNQAADSLLWLSPGETDETKWRYRIPALNIATNRFNTDKTEHEQEPWKNYDEPTEQELNPYILNCTHYLSK